MITCEELRRAGYLEPLDARFAETLARLARVRLGETPRPEVLLAAALASRQVAAGHICVDLAKPPVVTGESEEPIAGIDWPAANAWIQALGSSALVAKVGAEDEALPEAPLVLDGGGRVYLQRLWCHQKELASALLERARRTFEPHDPKALRRELERLFPKEDASFPWQRAAAFTAVRRALTVVTGGPGTGKTATVVRILAILVGEALAAGAPPPRIVLVAPTGKAAARLTESIEAAIPKLDCEAAIIAELPRTASTIHRALGAIGSTAPRFRHDAENPLVADVVVVDEVSMVDLALMNRLVAAVPEKARLVLLGDRDQLASVEAGAVLGDLCEPVAPGRSYSVPCAKELAALAGVELPRSKEAEPETGLRDSIVQLTHSYRYGATSGIGRLATAIREEDAAEALRILDADEFATVTRIDPPKAGPLDSRAEAAIVTGFRSALESADPVGALRSLDGFRVLSAHRRGPFGVETLNARIVELLRDHGLLGQGTGYFSGRAILVTRNDYGQSLFNGDVGLVMRDTEDRERLTVVFPAQASGARRISPARLPSHETAFAMTVHKSQGSEVDDLVLVVPEKSPLVTRELLYTAVTRARKGVLIQASREALDHGIRTRTARSSGLRDLLWREAERLAT